MPRSARELPARLPLGTATAMGSRKLLQHHPPTVSSRRQAARSPLWTLKASSLAEKQFQTLGAFLQMKVNIGERKKQIGKGEKKKGIFNLSKDFKCLLYKS